MRGLRLYPILIALGLLAAAGCGGPGVPQGNYGTLFGRVTNPSGQPIAGATITVDYVITTQTGADGSYRVTTVPADPSSAKQTVVQASKAGFVTQQQPANVPPNAQTEVDFTLQPS